MTRIRQLVGAVKLRRLTRTDWAYLHFKAALGVMLFIPILQNSSLKSQTTATFLTVWAVVTAAGLAVSLTGLVLGAQDGESRRKGIRIEMAGLWLLLAGPAAFLAVQVGILLTSGRSSGLAIMFPYVVCAAVLCRMVMLSEAATTVVYRIRGLDADED